MILHFRLVVLGLVVALMAALCFSRGDARTGAPEGWTRHMRGQPFVSQAVLASGPQSWNTWSLAAYQSFVAEQQASRITADLTLPESGRVVITPHYRANDARLPWYSVGSPKGMYLQLDGAGRR